MAVGAPRACTRYGDSSGLRSSAAKVLVTSGTCSPPQCMNCPNDAHGTASGGAARERMQACPWRNSGRAHAGTRRFLRFVARNQMSVSSSAKSAIPSLCGPASCRAARIARASLT